MNKIPKFPQPLTRHKEGKPIFHKTAITSESPLNFTGFFVSKQANLWKLQVMKSHSSPETENETVIKGITKTPLVPIPQMKK